MLGSSLLGWEPIGAVEFDPYAREVLLRRQQDGMLPMFPIWDDVRTLRLGNSETKSYCEAVREVAKNEGLVITAGFPCQPFSAAGNRKGANDSRNMWPDTCRILGELRPEIALLENVPRLLSFDYFGQILGDLAELGYDAEWEIVSAKSLGAPHQRDRLWILAYDRCRVTRIIAITTIKRNCKKKDTTSWWSVDPSTSTKVTNPSSKRSSHRTQKIQIPKTQDTSINSRAVCTKLINKEGGTEPIMERMVDGVANRVDRIKAIGNGQVPIVAAYAFVRLASLVGLDLNKYASNL